MKDVTLNINGKISLICFLSLVVLQPLLLILLKLGVGLTIISIIIYITAIPLLFVSIFFGVKQLRQTKFPLFWLIPAILYLLLYLFGLYTVFAHKGTRIYSPKRKIGIALKNTKTGKVLISAVYYKSPAEKAGMHAGDIITKIGEETIDVEKSKNVVDLIGLTNDNFLKVEVDRNGVRKTFLIDRNRAMEE